MCVVSQWGIAFVPPVMMGFFGVALGSLALWLGSVVTNSGGSLGGDRQVGVDHVDWPVFVGIPLGVLMLDERICPGFVVASFGVGSGVWLVSRHRTATGHQYRSKHNQ